MIEEQTSKGGFEFGALREAIEGKDPDALVGFYTEDAELRIVNAALPKGVAFELKGIWQIERYLHAVCEQEMSCFVEEEFSREVVFDEESITFREVCAYPEGSRISVETKLEIAEGRIIRQTDVVQRAHRDERSQR